MALTTEDKVKIGITVVVVGGMVFVAWEAYKAAKALGSAMTSAAQQAHATLDDIEGEGEAAIDTVTSPFTGAWGWLKDKFTAAGATVNGQ